MVWQEQTDGVLLGAFLRTQDAFFLDELVRRHGKMVLGVCRRVAGSACAEDAAQIVFISMLRRAESLSTRTNIGGWLYRAAWNVASRARRDAAARRANEIQAARQRPQPVASEFADDTAAELHRALNLLPDVYRDAIILHHLEGHTIEQVSRILEAPVGTVAARLSRGRQMLRAQMEANGIVVSSTTVAAILSEELPECALYVDWSARSMAMATLGCPVVTGTAMVAPGASAMWVSPPATRVPVPGLDSKDLPFWLKTDGIGDDVASGFGADAGGYALPPTGTPLLTTAAVMAKHGVPAAVLPAFAAGLAKLGLGLAGLLIGGLAMQGGKLLIDVAIPVGSHHSYSLNSSSSSSSAGSASSSSSSSGTTESGRDWNSAVNGVPEPSTLLLIGPLASALLLRRRSRGGPLAADAK